MDSRGASNLPYSDAAKRAADIVNGYITFTPPDQLSKCWLAIRLSDGGYDGVVYETKRDAVRHQSDEFLCAYVCLRNLAMGANPREMEIFLKFNRDAYDAGFRLPDPDDVRGGREVLMTSALHDHYKNELNRQLIRATNLDEELRILRRQMWRRE